MRTDEIERAALQRELGRLLKRPAEPHSSKRERRRRRHGKSFAGIDVPQQKRADAVKEWVAGPEHTHVAAAVCQHVLDGALEGTAPWARDTTDKRRGENKMPL